MSRAYRGNPSGPTVKPRVPFGIANVRLRPLFHMAAFIGLGVPLFEIRDFEKGTDLLVKSNYDPRSALECLHEVQRRYPGTRQASVAQQRAEHLIRVMDEPGDSAG